MSELRLPPAVLPGGFSAAVGALLDAAASAASSRLRDAYVTALPPFVAALRADLASSDLPVVSYDRTLVFVRSGVRVQVAPLDSWNDWWDGRTFLLEAGSEDVWVEAGGDVAPEGLSPVQLELYATLRHTDLWDPASAFEAARSLV